MHVSKCLFLGAFGHMFISSSIIMFFSHHTICTVTKKNPRDWIISNIAIICCYSHWQPGFLMALKSIQHKEEHNALIKTQSFCAAILFDPLHYRVISVQHLRGLKVTIKHCFHTKLLISSKYIICCFPRAFIFFPHKTTKPHIFLEMKLCDVLKPLPDNLMSGL